MGFITDVVAAAAARVGTSIPLSQLVLQAQLPAKMTTQLLTINPFSRSGASMVNHKKFVIHWTEAPLQEAQIVHDYYEGRKLGNDGYGSARFVIGLEGQVIEMIPEEEVAYHVGSAILDPASGKIYTDRARQVFGYYAANPETASPNFCCHGAELCILNAAGEMNPTTVETAIAIAADYCYRHVLNPVGPSVNGGNDPAGDVILHQEIVGYKNCHKWFLDHPDEWVDFKQAVADRVNALQGI